MFNIVLVEPEIPANTGNIARTCSVTGCSLHLIEPLGFSIDDKHLKRAGLDYWHTLDLHLYKNLEEYMANTAPELMFMATTKGSVKHTDVVFPKGAHLVFGKETKGLPAWLLNTHREKCFRIPMLNDSRSLNLSNSVAIVVYEAFRQHGFAGLR